MNRTPAPASAPTAGLLAAAAGEAVFAEGGFSPVQRVVFACLAGLLAAWLIAARRAQAARLARRPVILVLFALALLGGLSALWTEGFVGDAVRWGLVSGAYGVLAVGAGVLARERGGVLTLAVVICVLALVSGAIGLVGAALFAEPFADRVGGSWRPGGTLEYSSALALLQVSALPALLTAMAHVRRAQAIAGAVGASVAAVVLALAGSRVELALAALVCAAAVAWPRRSVGAGRGVALAAVVWLGAVGLAAHLVVGRYVAPGATHGGVGRLAALVAVCVGAVAVWRPLSGGAARVAPGARAAAVAAAIGIGLAGVALVAAASSDHRAGLEPSGGFWHGRLHTWDAALQTFSDRPWRGAGADAFEVASARHQQIGPVRFAHELPLELAVELGVAGGLLGLLLYAGAGAAVWRARGDPAVWLFGPAVLAFMAASLVDWPWHLAGSGAVWALALGGILAARADTVGQNPTS